MLSVRPILHSTCNTIPTNKSAHLLLGCPHFAICPGTLRFLGETKAFPPYVIGFGMFVHSTRSQPIEYLENRLTKNHHINVDAHILT